MIFTKEGHESAKFQTINGSGEISPNLYFDRLLLLKVYNIVMQNFKKNGFVVKMTRIWRILIRALKSLQNVHFDWSLSCKVYNVWPKKVQRSYLSWHWRVMQNLNKNWFEVWKMTWGTIENVKISTFMGSICLKYKTHELKSYRGVMLNDIKE